jgi:hypothetical protein
MMAMRFFSKAWLESEPDETAHVGEAYERFIGGLPGSVGRRIRNFAKRYNLNDALMDSFLIFPKTSTIEFALIEGDLARGYRQLVITYKNARIAKASMKLLKRYVEHRLSEILYDEFDYRGPAADRPYSHRFLLWPDHESVAITFSDFRFVETPVPSRGFVSLGQVFDPDA